MKTLINLFYPPQCPFCGVFHHENALCYNCWKSLHFLEVEFNAPYLTKKWFNSAYAILAYDGQVGEAIQSLKYKRQFDLVRIFAGLMVSRIKQLSSYDLYDLIIPVPLNWQRLIWRGYNQAGLLARTVAKQLSINYDWSILKRKKNIPAQVGLGRNRRLLNVKQAFDVRSSRTSKLEDKSILLIDDVMTTGATANECAKVLVKNGKCGRVDVLTIARTL